MKLLHSSVVIGVVHVDIHVRYVGLSPTCQNYVVWCLPCFAVSCSLLYAPFLFFFQNRKTKHILFHLLLLRYLPFSLSIFGSCFWTSFSGRCLRASLVSVLPTCGFIMDLAYCSGVRCAPVASCLSSRFCRYDKFQVVLGTTVPFEFELETEAPRTVEDSHYEVQNVPAKSYHGAQDITGGGNSVRDCTNEVLSFQKF